MTVLSSGGPEAWFDKLFVQGSVFWNDCDNAIEHICDLSKPITCMIARDLGTTFWLQMLHQREGADTDGKMYLTAKCQEAGCPIAKLAQFFHSMQLHCFDITKKCM